MKNMENFYMVTKLNLLFALSSVNSLANDLERHKEEENERMYELYNACVRMVAICENILSTLDHYHVKYDHKRADQYAQEHTLFETVFDFVKNVFDHQEIVEKQISFREIWSIGEVFKYAMYIDRERIENVK